MNEPYRLYLGDSRRIVPCLTEEIAAVVADPPYGIDYNPSGGNGVANRGQFEKIEGDKEAFDPTYLLGFPVVCLFGANHFANLLPSSSSWLVWYKRRDFPSINFSDCEFAWSNRGGPARVFDHRWHGMIRDSEMGKKRVHPTQKPVKLMEWVLDQLHLPEGSIILDPYMGSGTTGIACLNRGFKFVGIESNSDYFTQAEKRLRKSLEGGRQSLFEFEEEDEEEEAEVAA